MYTAFRLYGSLVFVLTFPNDPNITPRVVNDTRAKRRANPFHSVCPMALTQSNPSPSSSKKVTPLHSIILSTNCVTHMSMFPLSPDGWMNEKVCANPDIPISSSSPIVLLSSSPTVLNVDDDPRI